MAARYLISALGGAGALGIRRGSLPVLSARFLDPGRRARCRSVLEDGTRRVLLDCAHACRSGHVPARPRVVPAPGRSVCGRVLCAESVSLADRLLAERIRRTSGRHTAAPSAAVYSAAQGAWLSSGVVVESHAGGGMADERTRSGDDPLLSGWAGVALRDDWGRACNRRWTTVASTDLASSQTDNAGNVPGGRPGLVLSAPGHLRTGMDQHQRGAVTRCASAGQFYFHYHRRPRSQPLQSAGFDDSVYRNRRPGFRDLVFPPDEARRDSCPRLSSSAQRDWGSAPADANFRLGRR